MRSATAFTSPHPPCQLPLLAAKGSHFNFPRQCSIILRAKCGSSAHALFDRDSLAGCGGNGLSSRLLQTQARYNYRRSTDERSGNGGGSPPRRRLAHCCATTAGGTTETKSSVKASSRTKSLGVVITGGTKGLGFALARKFLESHDRVIICGRDEARLKSSIAKLREEIEGATIDGITCNVARESEVQRLAEFAVKRLGIIDRWLNNAGEVTAKKLLADVQADEIIRVSGTNVVGSLLCCREAIRCMRQQPVSLVPSYHIFNMGFTRWGAKFTKSSCTHKATKIALTQLTESLVEELKTAGISSIGVHNLSPGLVLTDLLLEGSTPVARRFFNTLAEEPETAAAILAPSIRQVQGTGHNIAVLSPMSAFCKVVTRFPQIIAGGRFFDKDGNRVTVAGKQYHDNGVEVIY